MPTSKSQPVLTTTGLLFCCLLLVSCRNLPEALSSAPPADWNSHVAMVTALEDWSLNGRLNIRQGNSSETVNLNWRQNAGNFDINLSGTLGLGAVHIYGTSTNVVLEKAGEEARLLPGLTALSQETLGYEFPAEFLLYWVRGLPVPTLPAESGWNEQGLLARLDQRDADTGNWSLDFDRYDISLQARLPGRIRLQHEGLQLTFLISAWQLPDAAP
jgi:outer membrane lipoprotein LolB